MFSQSAVSDLDYLNQFRDPSDANASIDDEATEAEVRAAALELIFEEAADVAYSKAVTVAMEAARKLGIEEYEIERAEARGMHHGREARRESAQAWDGE